MTRTLLSAWEWEPSIVIGCAGLVVLYLWAVRLRPPLRSLYFFAGVAILLLDLVSPLDPLSDDYLFSAHMAQHVVLILVVAPLLVLGVPAAVWRRALRYHWVRVTARLIGRPPQSWLIAIVVLYLWHIPYFYNAALASEPLHAFEHLTFLVTFVIFWWPIITTVPERQLGVGYSFVYLATAAMANSLLGILLTFVGPGLYPEYLHPHDELGILPLVREQWGLDPAADQQLGGLIMWISGGPLFLVAVIGALRRWYRTEEEEPAATAGRTDPGAPLGPPRAPQVPGESV